MENCNMTMKAESALNLLKLGINNANKRMILDAYNLIEDDKSFSWNGLEVIFMEWDKLVSEANDILLED